MDTQGPSFDQFGEDLAPVVLINVFTVDAADVPALLKAWEDDAHWMKQQPGCISTQLHRVIAGSCVFLNDAQRGGLAALVQQAGDTEPLRGLIAA